MLLLVVCWITAVLFSGASPSLIYVHCSTSKIVQPEIRNTSRYTSITPVLNKLHWLPTGQCLRQPHLFTSFCTWLHIFLPSAVVIVPSAVVVAISLSLQSSILLFINQSNSLVIVSLLMLQCLECSFRKQLKTYLYTKAYPL